MKIATLFSGIGSPEEGAKRVYKKFEIVFACEFDKFARQSYEANYDIASEHFHKDVNDLDATQYRRKVDILIGGSPCQAFSIAGLRNGTADERGRLIYQYIRVVEECKPEIIVYENVKGIMSITGGRTIREFVKALRNIGYHCHYGVVNTKDYGVPQNRERLFLVGFLNVDTYHRFEFAQKKVLTKSLKDVIEEDVDEKYYLKDKTIASVNRIIAKERGYARIVDTTTQYAKTLTSRMYRSYNADFFVDKKGIRSYTTIECLRLQDFPDTFKQVVSDHEIYKQVGNSISVNVIEMIFIQIEKAKKCEKAYTLMDFI